jgi:hypothetical protein
MATHYVLAQANDPTGLPITCGVLAAEDSSGGVLGEGAIGEGRRVSPALSMSAISLLRSVPDPESATLLEWLHGLDGMTNGVVRLCGPWSWDATFREVAHWTINESKLTPRAVIQVRDGRVTPFPPDAT